MLCGYSFVTIRRIKQVIQRGSLTIHSTLYDAESMVSAPNHSSSLASSSLLLGCAEDEGELIDAMGSGV